MECVQLRAPNDLRLVRLPIPQPGPEEVLVRVRAAGVCHTDLLIVQGVYPVPMPRVLGHEIAGVVEAVGSAVATLTPGDRVGVYPARFCGTCAECRRGQYRACHNFEGLGNTLDGGWAEYVVAREKQCVRLGSLTYDEGVWLEPISCLLRALSGIDVRSTRSALIMGAGSLGLLALLLLRELGAPFISVADPNAPRLESARQVGADAVLLVPRTGPAASAQRQLRETTPGAPDLVFDTTGRSATITRAVVWGRHGATVVVFGVPQVDSRLAASLPLLFSKEITIRGSAGNGPEEYIEAVRLVGDSRLPVNRLDHVCVSRGALPVTIANLLGGARLGKVIASD